MKMRKPVGAAAIVGIIYDCDQAVAPAVEFLTASPNFINRCQE
jgi:hypothetical protein